MHDTDRASRSDRRVMVLPLSQHPFNALFTAVRISSTVISPSLLASPALQSDSRALPRAMFTMVRMSSTVTSWLSE